MAPRTAQSDRRIHSRTRTHIAARLEQQGVTIDGIVENVGVGGVFFATEELDPALDEGLPVTLQFDARRGDETLTLRPAARLLRTERYFDGVSVVRAFAIQFDELLDIDGLAFE